MTQLEFRRRLGDVIKMDRSWIDNCRRWLIAPKQPHAWTYCPPFNSDALPDEFFVAVGFMGGVDMWLWPIAEQIETHVRNTFGICKRTGTWAEGTDPAAALRTLLKPGDQHPLGVPFELALIDDPTAFEEALAAWQAEGGVLCDS